jgi:hypothetical protein
MNCETPFLVLDADANELREAASTLDPLQSLYYRNMVDIAGFPAGRMNAPRKSKFRDGGLSEHALP